MAAERGNTQSPARRASAVETSGGATAAGGAGAARGLDGVAGRLRDLEARVQEEAARISGLVAKIDARDTATEDTINVLMDRVDQLRDSVVKLGDENQQVTAGMTTFASQVETAKAKLTTDLSQELDNHKLALVSIVNDARQEFQVLRTELQGLALATTDTFVEVKTKVEQLEHTMENGAGRGGG